MSKSTYSIQLSTADNLNVSDIIFGQVRESKIPGSVLSYQRINLSVKNPDGSTGDLILRTSPLFSFGVQESKSMETKEVNGYVMPLCMWNRNNPTEEEKQWTNVFSEICNRCKEYLVEHRADFGKWDLEMNDLKKFNPLHWKRDKATGKIEEGKGPTLYVKLISSKKDGKDKILSLFYDSMSREEIDPLTMLNKRCEVTAAIKIESIFIGKNISLQVKLWEVVVTPIGGHSRRLLLPDIGNETSQSSFNRAPEQVPASTYQSSSPRQQDDISSDISESEEEDQEYVPKQPSPPRKTTTRKTAKKN